MKFLLFAIFVNASLSSIAIHKFNTSEIQMPFSMQQKTSSPAECVMALMTELLPHIEKLVAAV